MQFILHLNNFCNDSAIIDVEVYYEEDIFIPNAFSPNGDRVNDIFTVFGSPEVAQVKTMLVFDRWGELVYERNSFPPNTICWDGVFNGKMMDVAVFMYYVEVEMNNGDLVVKKGDVSLIR